MISKPKEGRTVAKTREPKKRQTPFPGMEQVKCPAVEKAARKFLDLRDERFEMIKDFSDAKLNLISAMADAKLQTYEFDGYRVDLNASQAVKVKKRKVEAEDE